MDTLATHLVHSTLHLILVPPAGVPDVMNGATGSGSEFLNPRKVNGFADSKYDKRRGVTICHNYRPEVSLLFFL